MNVALFLLLMPVSMTPARLLHPHDGARLAQYSAAGESNWQFPHHLQNQPHDHTLPCLTWATSASWLVPPPPGSGAQLRLASPSSF